MEIADELLLPGDVLIEAIFSADPQGAFAIDKKGVYPGVREGIRVAFDREINCKLIAVEFVQAGFGTKPEKAFGVGSDGKNRILRKSAFYGNVAEQKMWPELGVESGRDNSNCQEQEKGAKERKRRREIFLIKTGTHYDRFTIH